MTKFDRDYMELVNEIYKNGVLVENRTGIDTLKIPSFRFEFDLSSEFPILETKSTVFRNAVTEMLWIWQQCSNNVSWLQERKNPIWNEWMVDDDGIYRIYEPEIPGKEYNYDPEKEVIVMDPLSVPISDPFGYRYEMQPKYIDNGTVMKAKSIIPGKTIKAAKFYGKQYAGTIGTAYGWITKRYEMPNDLQYVLRNHPNDRRIVKSFYQNEFMRTAVLPPCVWSTTWDVTDGKLNVIINQRSCDVPLGLPFNVTQYATLLRMMAQTTGLEPGKITYVINNAHIYINQIDGIKEQISRWDKYREMKSWSMSKLIGRQLELTKILEIKKDFIKDDEKDSIDTELKIIDIILNPSTPDLWLNPDVKDFFGFDSSIELNDCKVKGYKHMGRIKMPIAQ